MPNLFRVIPWNPKAQEGSPGHAAFQPRSVGAGRIDNPDLFNTMYLSSHAESAIAEVFQRHPVWDDKLFMRTDGRQWALASFRVDLKRVLNLDSGPALAERQIKPSHVVAISREVTQAWARRIHEEGRWIGVSWWSNLDSQWSVYGLWKSAAARLATAPERIDERHPLVRATAQHLRARG